MRKLLLLLLFLITFLVVAACWTQRANSQTTVVYDPVIAPMAPVVAPPVVYETYRPIVSGPVVTNDRWVESYDAAPVTTYRPITYDPVLQDLPAASYPITPYRRVVRNYRPVLTDGAPVIYDPIVTSYYSPVVYPKVFVAGQPVRNLFRAITP